VGLGVLLETLDQVALQVSYLASGQRVPNDIKTACGREVAALILSDKG
jgi:flagellar biosynthesis GTPase FlhF